MFQRVFPIVISVCLAVGLSAQATSPQKSEAELDRSATAANELYRNGHTLDSLPLYEELHARRPNNAIYTERLAMAYIAKGGADSAPAQAVADRNHARELFQLARTQGDNSDLLQVMLEKLGPPETAASAAAALPADDPRVPGRTFVQAEQLFSKGDLPASIALYRQTWDKFPKFYSAPLFAGDAEYKLGHFDEAGVWFARAIAINTDIETAHRYWADCLMKAGKPVEARTQYILAFIADPYSKAPRLSLRAWADAEKFRYIPPLIQLLARAETDAKGGSKITLDPKLSPPFITAWTTYALTSTSWQLGEFSKRYPNEKTYRHSLAEEAESLRAALKSLRTASLPEAEWDSSFRALADLERDNMLECWILLDHPDQGVAQDYLAYRAAHRDLLKAYIEKYDLHPA